MANTTSVYAGIVKFDKQPDGTVIVYGKATDDTIDSDEQICDPAWLSKAMPEWFKYGNIREQHSNIAAGVATDYEAKGSEHWITAHVVDPGSAKKVETGTLKGFSIGIRGARVAKDNKANGGRIIDGQIVEVSLVDRPANPACTLVMAKSVGSDVIQVEELMEEEGVETVQVAEIVEEVVAEEVAVEEVVEAPKTAGALIDMAKAIAGDDVTNKFDQAMFDMARRGLAGLLAVEAMEMAEGSDETDSIACLFAAIHALFEFHQDEAAEGEAEEIEGGQGDTDVDSKLEIELSDEADVAKEDGEDMEMCDKCNMAMKECKCAEGGYSATEMSAEEKAAKKSAKAEAKAQKREQKNSELRELIAEVVKTVLTTPEGGMDTVTKAVESERIEALESELAQVKSLAAPTGPKRMAQSVSAETSVNKSLAAEYRYKAKNTLDKSLAMGYLKLAADLEKSESN